MDRRLIVTIDTEVDKDRRWQVSTPVTFESVVTGVPGLLSPLFDEYGVVPTYLLSPEVMEDSDCADVMRALGDRAELGTHLHGEFISPERRLDRSNMAGALADTAQCQYGKELEAAKLASLTELFRATFGRRPTSFRAGRYGLGPDTFSSLASLGYKVDSSVTPGLVWRYPQATLDYRSWGTDPIWIETPSGPLLEAPVGIRAGGPVAPIVDEAPRWVARGLRGILGDRARHLWLRPSWVDGPGLIRYVKGTSSRTLVLMFHSIEITPGASPYAADTSDVARIVASLRGLFEHCIATGIGFCGLTDIVADA